MIKVALKMNDIFKKINIKSDIFSITSIIIIAFIGGVIISNGVKTQQYNLMLSGLIFIFTCNVGVFLLNAKKRLLCVIFYCMVFLFLISRVIIPAIKGEKWWENIDIEANVFAIIAIALSLVALAIGLLVTEILIKHYQGKHISVNNRKLNIVLPKREIMMNVLRVLLCITVICFFINEIDKLMFMQGKEYEQYYISYQSKTPFLIISLGGCMTCFLCAFLALKPTKKECFIWLLIYVASSVPMLIIGARNPFILNCLFAFLYYYLRDFNLEKGEKKWLGKIEKIIVICAIPLLIIAMGAYNYTRADKDVDTSLLYLTIDFAYKQGTTYDTVLQGYKFQDELPCKDNKNYTLGAITDSFFYSTLGQKLFEKDDIGGGNCLKHAYNGHTFSHAISYVVLGEKYIAGEGRGSSYIIENYVDGGMTGILIFSVILGGLCAYIPVTFGKKWIISTLLLSLLLNFYFTPRAESTAFITFLFSFKYWACIIGIIIISIVYEFMLNKFVYKTKLD